MERTLIPVNPGDRDWTRHRFVLWFGACGPTYLLVWANSLDDALDEGVDWIEEHAPGLLCDDQVAEEYQRAVDEGLDDDAARERAEVDTTCAGNHGRYLPSEEWGIAFENPSRGALLAFLGRARNPSDVDRFAPEAPLAWLEPLARAAARGARTPLVGRYYAAHRAQGYRAAPAYRSARLYASAADAM